MAQKKANKRSAAHQEDYDLLLYVGGATERSRLGIANVKSVGEKYLKGRYRLLVVDLFQDPAGAREHDIIVVPTLVKRLPLPLRRMVGDLSSEDRVLIGLGLVPASAPVRRGARK